MTSDRSRDADELPLLVDSGRSGDEVHTVALRPTDDGARRGLIRGDLPGMFVWRSTVYVRSAFAQRDDLGALEYSYFPKPGRRPSGERAKSEL